MKVYFDNVFQFDYPIVYKDVPPKVWHPMLFDDERIKKYIADNLAVGKVTMYDFIYDQSTETSDNDEIRMRAE